ncbi:unnamed protein product [Rodentolepis nana]|uniref:GINS complex subunit 1 n=1 Tax=Rodentolepis nana TaxID=102285 RepID=A0A0R3U0J2_RODNA|nr:unnamed protein product [Rodentolepis nana]
MSIALFVLQADVNNCTYSTNEYAHTVAVMQTRLEDYMRNIDWLDGKLFPPANELELCLDKLHSIRYHAAEEKKVKLSRSQSDGLPKTTTTITPTTTTTTAAGSKCPVYLRLFNKNSISRLLVQWEHDKIINIIERSGFTVTYSHAVDLLAERNWTLKSVDCLRFFCLPHCSTPIILISIFGVTIPARFVIRLAGFLLKRLVNTLYLRFCPWLFLQ